MFIDLLSQPDGSRFSADVCIAGAGPAGITLALELARRGITSVLLESGGMQYEESVQSLYDGKVTGHANTDVSYSRLRQFGGTSGHWTGMCAPLEAIDFEARDGVPHSGWPITRAALDPFYERAQPYLDLGPYKYSLDEWGVELNGSPLPLDPAQVVPSVYQMSAPTRFAEKYAGNVEADENITCILHASVTDIVLADGTSRVDRVTIATLDGQTAGVTAKAYVLACGGIENPRVLLNAASQRQSGLGNENDLVGRFFMDHLNTTTGNLVLSDDETDMGFYDQATETAQLLIGMTLPAQVKRTEKLLNNAAFMSISWESQAHNDDFRDHAWLAFSTLAKSLSRGQAPERLTERLCTVAEAPGSVLTGLARHIQRQFSGSGRISAITFKQDAEQAPDPDSRVTLNDDVDALGLRRIDLDWRVSEQDMLSLRRTHELIGRAFGSAGLGRVQLGIENPPSLDNVYTGYHHMGTTRMHDDPRQGVVDANCRVHSVDNLFVAGSSVFTTGGMANPTLTITALAIRLADHLADDALMQLA
jgi:choline dehydrogenase-like flavoprotein|tara:strand:- start:1431 stop:3032 length:1602 start_codon:yes stop_codon:yes gene_type:complete